MAPERLPEVFDSKNLNEELPDQQRQGDTPSPRTPSTSSSLSPPPPAPLLPQFTTTPNALLPLLTEDGIPYDHTLPQFIRQVSGEPTLDEVQNMSLRVFTESASLQQMSLYTPNLRELNLSGSALSSLRDIGCELRFLHILRISRCRLRNLDGTMGLVSLRELYADGNMIASAAPCAHLPHLKVLDLSRNLITDKRTLSFLSSCKHLEQLKVEGNSVASDADLENFLQSIIPTLHLLNDATIVETSIASTSISQVVTNAIQSRSRRGSLPSLPLLQALGVGDDLPGPSSASSISLLTSGQILCGNIGALRRRRASLDSQDPGDKKDDKVLSKETSPLLDPLDASRRWRAAYYKFRDTNATRWNSESQENKNGDEEQKGQDDNEVDDESSPYDKEN